MVISIETSKATFTLSVQPRFIQNNGPEQPTFVQHHDQCAPISVVVKCPLPSVKLEDVRNADISTLWKAVFHGFKPAAMTLAAEHDHYFQAFLGQYRELLNEEIEELGQIGGTVRFACKREDMEVVEGSSQSVERWYVVDGRTMQLAGMCPRCFARAPQSIFRKLTMSCRHLQMRNGTVRKTSTSVIRLQSFSRNSTRCI